MSRTRHSLTSIVTGVVVVVAWVVFCAVALATADPLPDPVTAVVRLVVPPLLWVALLQIGASTVRVVRLCRSRSRTSAIDLPSRLLTATVAALPEHRREWGIAMLAELTAVRGRPARWQFALSSARAVLWLSPAGGRPMPALLTGAVVASVAAVGPAVGMVVPGLRVFAMTFIGLVGAMVVLAVARSRRPRPPVPAPALLVTAGVAAAIVATVIFLRREPAAAEHLSPPVAVCLAAVLAGCLWIAVASPRWLGADRLPAHLGAVAAVVFAAWFLLTSRTGATEPPPSLVLLLGAVSVSVPIAAFFVPAFALGRMDGSFRSGLRATVWTVTTVVPLTFAIWLPEAMRRHAIDGRTLDGELTAPVGVNLADALAFCLGIFPALGLTLGVLGAALGARRASSARPAVIRGSG